MILVLLDVVIPVFLVIGAGYLATRSGQFKSSAVDGLNVFTQKFAIPCLLFQATMTLDLAAVIKWDLLISFYAGATICFVLGTLGSRYVFGRSPGEAVAIGFGALFSNSVLLGLPITERAYGTEGLGELCHCRAALAVLLWAGHNCDGICAQPRPIRRGPDAQRGSGDVS